MDLPLIFSIVAPTVLFTAGAAWGAVRNALNGTRERMERVELRLEGHITESGVAQRDVVDRLARIETRIETQ